MNISAHADGERREARRRSEGASRRASPPSPFQRHPSGPDLAARLFAVGVLPSVRAEKGSEKWIRAPAECCVYQAVRDVVALRDCRALGAALGGGRLLLCDAESGAVLDSIAASFSQHPGALPTANAEDLRRSERVRRRVPPRPFL